MEFGVLGSIEVRRGADVVQIGSRNERKLLTALLVDVNSVVSTSRLIDVLSADNPPALTATPSRPISPADAGDSGRPPCPLLS